MIYAKGHNDVTHDTQPLAVLHDPGAEEGGQLPTHGAAESGGGVVPNVWVCRVVGGLEWYAFAFVCVPKVCVCVCVVWSK